MSVRYARVTSCRRRPEPSPACPPRRPSRGEHAGCAGELRDGGALRAERRRHRLEERLAARGAVGAVVGLGAHAGVDQAGVRALRVAQRWNLPATPPPPASARCSPARRPGPTTRSPASPSPPPPAPIPPGRNLAPGTGPRRPRRPQPHPPHRQSSGPARGFRASVGRRTAWSWWARTRSSACCSRAWPGRTPMPGCRPGGRRCRLRCGRRRPGPRPPCCRTSR